MSMLTAYLLLAVAIFTEIAATSALPATEGFKKLKPSIISIAGYCICFYCMGMALTRLPLGIAYGTWGGHRYGGHAADRLYSLPPAHLQSRRFRRGPHCAGRPAAEFVRLMGAVFHK